MCKRFKAIGISEIYINSNLHEIFTFVIDTRIEKVTDNETLKI